MTTYLTLRSDEHYSRTTPTDPLLAFLRTFPELAVTGAMEVRNSAASRWVSVVLARCNETGSYASNDEYLPEVNIVELICGDEHDDWYAALACRIAEFLGWEAIENEHERRLWPPAKHETST